MVFLKYLRRELRLWLRQAAVMSAGLGIAVGAGLLITAGPASAAQSGASHAAAHASQVGRRCHIRVPSGGGTIRLRCCPPQIRRGPGRPFTVNCCPAPVPPPWTGRQVVPGCCPAQLPVPPGHPGPVRVQCCLAPVPPPWRHFPVHIQPGGPARHYPVPMPVRCVVGIGHGG